MSATTTDTNIGTTTPSTPLPLLPFPPHVLSILGTEAMERFSYYGIRCLLVLYLTSDRVGLSETSAISLYAYAIAAAYLSPVLGAVCSDSSAIGWGRYTTILRFGCVYVAGMAVVSVAAVTGSLPWTIVGLAGICVGTGGIKPCVSSFGADQLGCLTNDDEDDDGDDPILRRFFSTFYVSINVGSLVAFLVLPIVRVRCGFAVAFSVCAVALASGLWLFWVMRGSYVAKGGIAGRDVVGTTVRIVYEAMTVRYRWWRHGGIGRRSAGGSGRWLDAAMEADCVPVSRGGGRARDSADGLGKVTGKNLVGDETGRNKKHERAVLSLDVGEVQGLNEVISAPDIPYTKEDVNNANDALKTLPVMACLPIFWMLYDQQGSAWTLQAKDMHLHGIEPEQVGVLNPLLVMILIPLFERKIYPGFQGCGCHLSHLSRMKWGMLLSAIAFSISGFVETAVEKGSILAQAAEDQGVDGNAFRVSIWWQFPQIAILTTAEILVSVTGLEFSYANSPASMKSLIMAMFFLTSAVGNFFGGVLYSVLADLDRAIILHLCSFLMLVTMGVFQKIQRRWEFHRSYDPEVLFDLV